MALLDMHSPQAIIDAIEEFDRVGRDVFLKKYGFGYARQYYLEYKGKRYDSKAIVGVAHGYEFPDRGQLHSSDFSGGKATVKRKLEELGFTVKVLLR